jgi:hypothetical protein
MKRFFKPVQTFLEQAFLQVSKADGKPGLSLADLEVVIAKVKTAQDEFPDEGAGALRVAFVKKAINMLFPGRVPEWLIDVIVFLAYAIAQRKGII